MAALGNDPRLAAMLVSAKNDDAAGHRGKNCRHSLNNPPRMGNSDLGVAFLAINQPGSNVVSNC
ncbi:hypothetical protein ACLK2F_00840 [Escherichia coli]